MNRYRPEQPNLHKKHFSYSNDIPIEIVKLSGRRKPCGVQFHRKHIRLASGSKHKVCKQDCEEKHQNKRDPNASGKEEEPMLFAAAKR